MNFWILLIHLSLVKLSPLATTNGLNAWFLPLRYQVVYQATYQVAIIYQSIMGLLRNRLTDLETLLREKEHSYCKQLKLY